MEQLIFSGIRLAGDEISSEEWIDPLEKAEDLPTPVRREMPKAINLAEAAGLGDDHGRTVYSITIPESEFMHFNIENDGSPATIVALFLCRAIAKMYPDAEDTLKSYAVHPAHVEVANNKVRPFTSGRVCMDYEVEQ